MPEFGDTFRLTNPSIDSHLHIIISDGPNVEALARGPGASA